MWIDDIELAQLFLAGESFRVERKEALTGSAPNAIREAICAFANDLPAVNRPGVVFIGARDDGTASGAPISDELLRQLADMKTDGAIVPPPSLLVGKRRLGDTELAVVSVLPSDSPPVRYRGAIHMRIGPRKGLATAQDERILNEKRRHRDSPHDIWPVAHASLADLRLRYFEEDYLPRAFSAEVIETNDRTLEQRLAATKMIASIDDLVPTRLGVYVLGKTPRFLLENFYVQFLRVDGADLGDPVLDAGLIEGTIAEIAAEMESRLRSHIHVGVDNASGELEVRTPTYPIVALRELARNAILHRSYEGTHAPARINWFEDRVEIINPGGPYGLAAVSPFGAPGVTDYRNPNLAEAMRVLGLVQRFGVGIAGARKALRDNGNPELEFEVDANHVRAIVRRRG